MTLSQGVILQLGGWVPLNFTAYSKQQAFPVTSSSQTSPFCQLPGQDLTLKMQSQNQEWRQQMRLQQGFTSQQTLSNGENPANGVTTGGRWGFQIPQASLTNTMTFKDLSAVTPAEVHWPKPNQPILCIVPRIISDTQHWVLCRMIAHRTDLSFGDSVTVDMERKNLTSTLHSWPIYVECLQIFFCPIWIL